MEPLLCITDPQGGILKDPNTLLPLYAREKESQAVVMDQQQRRGSTPAAMIRRSAPLGKDKDHMTSPLLHVLTGLSVSVQEEGRTASSTTGCVVTGRDVVRCAGGDNHTARGTPRTGTNMMVSGNTIQGRTGQETNLEDITGDPDILEIDLINLNF